MENSKSAFLKSGRGRLLEIPTMRLKLEKILVFWIGGRFLEVVAHGGSIVFKSVLFLNVLFNLRVALFIQ